MGVILVAASILLMLTGFVLVAKLYWDWRFYKMREKHCELMSNNVPMHYL